VPMPGFSSYTAAKHALRGFLNTLQIEEREQRSGVRVAMVSPGPIDTPIYERASSGTGRRPAILPDAYSPETVAAALVEAILAPRHEHVVGGVSKLVDLLYRGVRPAGERVLLLVDRWFRTGTLPADTPGALWEPAETPRRSGGMPSRDRGDVVALARHAAGALKRAPALLRPVPERRRGR
jgi:NAD(P)-dependent dehydrogenase (short-subunit alcohol dehydrogenase family)